MLLTPSSLLLRIFLVLICIIHNNNIVVNMLVSHNISTHVRDVNIILVMTLITYNIVLYFIVGQQTIITVAL